jgi:hypothetical protein
MKKIGLITLLVLVSVFVFAEAIYTYNGTDNIWFNGELLENGDTVTVDEYMYMDDFTLTSSTPTDILMSVTSVSTTSVATQTIAVDELAEVKLELDVGATNASPITLYFNSTDTEGISLTADWEMTLNTKYFYQVILVNTATTTAYNFIVTKELD